MDAQEDGRKGASQEWEWLGRRFAASWMVEGGGVVECKGEVQRRYDMRRHEMMTQHAPFCIGVMAKKGTLSQHFVSDACSG